MLCTQQMFIGHLALQYYSANEHKLLISLSKQLCQLDIIYNAIVSQRLCKSMHINIIVNFTMMCRITSYGEKHCTTLMHKT